jgi:hypothetical protein
MGFQNEVPSQVKHSCVPGQSIPPSELELAGGTARHPGETTQRVIQLPSEQTSVAEQPGAQLPVPQPFGPQELVPPLSMQISGSQTLQLKTGSIKLDSE